MSNSIGTEDSTAISRWKSIVSQHHVQSERVNQGVATGDDQWDHIADLFKEDPHRTGDEVLNAVLSAVSPQDDVLDVGGGAGRYALPLALHCRRVTVVEPSMSMAYVLRQSAEELGVKNLFVLQQPWQKAIVSKSDVVLCAHVLDGVEDVVSFIRKMESHAAKRMVLIESTESPIKQFASLWEHVYNEKRASLPALDELLGVLTELEIEPAVTLFKPEQPGTVPSAIAARKLVSKLLNVAPGTVQDQRLRSALDNMLIATEGGFSLRGSAPRQKALLSWEPSSPGPDRRLIL